MTFVRHLLTTYDKLRNGMKKKAPKYPRFNFRTDDLLARRIEELAKADNRTTSAFIRHVLKLHIAAAKRVA